MRRIFKGLALASVAAVGFQAHATTFKTQFIKFELPPNWRCTQEEIDWVCQPDDLAARSEAIIVVVTKAVNEVDDTMPQYEKVLNTPRDMRDLLGNAYKSQVKYTRPKVINSLTWMDSLHLGSEIPGFYTRYIAGIKEKVAGLITYSVAESVYPKYAPLLDQMVNSLELFFDPKAFADAMNAGPTSLFGSRGKGAGGRLAPKMGDQLAQEKKDTKTDPTQIVGGALVLGALGYYLYKKKNG